MRNEECVQMRNEYINDIVHLLYESGRHDRSKKWIWYHFIRPFVGINYQTFLKETQQEVPLEHKRLVELVAKLELMSERGKMWLEKEHCQDLLPDSTEIDEVLKQLKELQV